MPSQWRQRYPRESTIEDDTASLSNWIEEVQRKADTNELYEDKNYEYQLRSVMSSAVSSSPLNLLGAAPSDSDVADVIARMEQILSSSEDHNASFNFDDYLESSSNESSAEISIDYDHPVDVSFRNRTTKRCFDELVRHCKSEKKRLGWIEKIVTKQQRMKLLSKYLISWKSINRMIRVKEAMLACKIGRATSSKFRRAFVEWKRLMLTRREQCFKIDSRLRRKVCRRVFYTLMKNKEQSLLEMERARARAGCIQRSRVLASWRMVVRNQRKLNERAETFHRTRLMQHFFGAWSSLPRTRKEAHPHCMSVQVKSNDDELLRPLRNPRRRQSLRNSTPKIITDMARRNDERLQRKEVLRSRKEKAAIAKRQMLNAERHNKEQRELSIHREFVRKKQVAKEQKEQEVIRYREASRLAVLHYKFSLQKRCLLQWKRIFGINGWNERKAIVFLRDAMYEKYFSCWYRFSKNKALRAAKRHHLAVDFHETSLLAKAFASLEENMKHSNHLYSEAASRISTLRKRTVLRDWHRKSFLLVKERQSKESEAKRVGKTFFLRRALHAWKVGISVSREEARLEQLVDDKYVAMMEWLEASRKDFFINDPY